MREQLLRKPCVVCGERTQSLHHVLRRSQGGDDVTVNLAPVCGTGTTGCHGRIEARDPEALHGLWAWVTSDFIRYLAYKLGDSDRAWDWCERNLKSAAPALPARAAETRGGGSLRRTAPLSPPAAPEVSE